MNILVIGNGFDLAHGLPTKYTDFWSWIKDLIYIKGRIDWGNKIPTNFDDFLKWSDKREKLWAVKFDDSFLNHYLKLTARKKRLFLKTDKMKVWIWGHCKDFDFDQDIDKIDYDIVQFVKNDMENKKKKLENFDEIILEILKFYNSLTFYNRKRIVATNKFITNDIALKIFFLINRNFWVQYFLKEFDYMEISEDNWIDFEKEIANFVINLNEDKERVVSEYSYYIHGSTYRTPTKVIEILDYDLKRFILLLEIYLCVYIQNMNCEKLLKDVAELDVEHVISFNYTNTYERLYGYNKEINYDYIHGKANINNTIESNNMVLGIDEYLPDDRKDKDTDFIAFKKYYQRIYKGTGSKYKEWVDQIKEDYWLFLRKYERAFKIENKHINSELQAGINKHKVAFIRNEKCKTHNVYIFGHSLDVTDKDVLRDLILNDNVYTTIFYHSKDELGRKIANLVKVIGQDELIRRTGGSTKTIEFKEQQKMVQVEK